MIAPSKTAEYVAFYRALETLERRREPLFRDVFAAGFLSPTIALLLRAARLGPMHRVVSTTIDHFGHGARLASALRTRFFDDLALECSRQGIRQLVVLGAGFDCRAHRLDALSSVDVFEVDRDEMGEAKRAGLRRAGGRARADIRYVGLDLVREAPDEGLVQSGWNATMPTLFLCEGVTNYLTESAVLRILSSVGRAAPRSCLAFSYVHRALIEGNLHGGDGDELHRRVRGLTEPWKFGIDPADVGDLLARHGLTLREELGVDACWRRYWGEPDSSHRGRTLFGCARIAVADV